MCIYLPRCDACTSLTARGVRILAGEVKCSAPQVPESLVSLGPLNLSPAREADSTLITQKSLWPAVIASRGESPGPGELARGDASGVEDVGWQLVLELPEDAHRSVT